MPPTMGGSDSESAVAQRLRWASRPTDDADTRRFYQQRVALLAKMMMALFTTITVLAAVLLALQAPERFVRIHTDPNKILSYLMLGVWFGMWMLLRGRPRPGWLVRACDLGGLLMVSSFLGGALVRAPLVLPLHFAGLAIGLLLLVLRAALVPSSPGWTALVGVLCGTPILIGTHLRNLASPFVAMPAGSFVFVHVIWWLAATAATTVVSRTIYGLITQMARVTRLGQYTLLEKIGEGGMGEVYRAQHGLLRRPTAVKLLLPGRTSPETLARFEREVQLTSRLSHPNTIAIYDYGRTADGVFYYAMEYLDGLSLEQLVRQSGALPPGRALHLLLQVSEALAEAHAVGLIHRDIKPANVMVCERGGVPDVAKVLDFGLVKQLDPGAGDVHLTVTNAVAGTPLYMAPEAVSGGAVDARADLYALGAVAYFLLTGAPPFMGRTVVEICGHHLHTPPVPPSQLARGIPPALEAVVLACLAKSPAERPQDARALHARLAAAQAEVHWSRAEAEAWWSERRARGAPVAATPS
jgi:predicted Ser/Thr protein kinase